LLHPLVIDEAGLSSALRWYGGGICLAPAISSRSDRGRFGGCRVLGDCHFRVVQESSLYHRHDQSPSQDSPNVKRGQNIGDGRDRGQGPKASPTGKTNSLASAAPPGGVRGMRERLRNWAGALEGQLQRGGHHRHHLAHTISTELLRRETERMSATLLRPRGVSQSRSFVAEVV